MTTGFTPVTAGARLSDQVAQQLSREIRSGRRASGERLPAEAKLAEQFEVSRTVVREAMSRLKSLGLVDARQGSGVFVAAAPPFAPLNFDTTLAASKSALSQMIEVRRALEADAAGSAAERRTNADKTAIRAAIRALDQAVASGRDGVEEDLLFHRSVALAAHNPFLLGTLDYLAQFMRRAIKVTRANEARRADFTADVRSEHATMVAAIIAGDALAARAATQLHLTHAIGRLEQADAAFWTQQGIRLALPIMKKIGAKSKKNLGAVAAGR